MYATCHTPDCGNAEAPIPVPADAGTVLCGVCSQPITDLAETTPNLPEELPPWDV